MGVKIWIDYFAATEDYYITTSPTPTGAGPIEISMELYERIMECERERSAVQNILEMLEYEWTYPDDEDGQDCD